MHYKNMILIKVFFLTMLIAIMPFTFCQANDGSSKSLEDLTVTQPTAQPLGDFANTAHFKVINRNDGKTEEITIKAGKDTTYQNYIFKVSSCWQESGNSLRLNSRALLEIFTEDMEQVFSGWIFSEHPSLTSFPDIKFNMLLQKCTDELEKTPETEKKHSEDDPGTGNMEALNLETSEGQN